MSDIKNIGLLNSSAQLDIALLNAKANRAMNLNKPSGIALSGTKDPVAHEKEIEKAATQFEALLVHEMFKSMWSSVPKDGMLSGSKEEELYQDMLTDAVADSVAKNQSLGIKDVIISDIKKTEARKKAGS